MANKNIDLNKLKEEIDNRKKGRTNVSVGLGETQKKVDLSGRPPRDVFLHGLLESLNSGVENHSTSLVKTVENVIAEKKGTKTFNISENAPTTPPTNLPPQSKTANMGDERDELFYKNLEKRKNETLSGTLNQYANTPPPKQNNVPQQQGMGMINEQTLNNAIQNTITDNFAHLVGEAIDSAVIEMFTLERIKKVLEENTDLIKAVVLQTIKEIQSKRKAN